MKDSLNVPSRPEKTRIGQEGPDGKDCTAHIDKYVGLWREMSVRCDDDEH